MKANLRTAVVGFLLGCTVTFPLAADAHPIEGGDWTDNHQLCLGCSPDHGNLIATWQSFLWAEGFHNKCNSSGIDGIFGSITKADTKDWQNAKSLTADGIVGSGSWGHAKQFDMNHLSGDSWRYEGEFHFVRMLTQGSSPSQWYFDTPTDNVADQYFLTGHPDITFNTC